MWLSIRPGNSTWSAKRVSTVTSRPWRQTFMSSRVPTATMRPCATATAVACGSDSSMVWMRRAVKMVSGGRAARSAGAPW